MSAHRVAFGLCIAVLATTLAAKIALLCGASGGLIDAIHPGLGVRIRSLVQLGVVLEVAALAGAFFGRRIFGLGSVLLGFGFVAFHLFLTFAGLAVPCRCLGTLTQWHPWLAENESAVAVLLAWVLIGAGSVLLRSSQDPAPEAPSTNGLAPAAVSAALWVACAGLVIVSAGSRSLGGDEGMELSKAFSHLRDPAGFARSWNDQSPVFSWMIAGVWKVTGFSIPAARWLTALLTALIPFSVALTLRPWGLSWAALALGPGMLLHPTIAPILGSCMQDLPAVALGAASVIPLVLLSRWPAASFPASVLVAGFALYFKPTAAFGCVLLAFHLPRRLWMAYGVSVLTWLTWCLAISGLVGSDLLRAIAAHSYHGPEVDFFAVRLAGAIAPSASFLCIAAVGAFLSGRFCAPKVAAWIVGSFALFLAIHVLHRPFWDYYSTHLAIPIVVLLGVGIVSAVRARAVSSVVCSSIFLAISAGLSFPTLTSAIYSGVPIAGMAGHAIRTQAGPIRSVLSEEPWLALSADATPVPETVMVPYKRGWIGDWTPLDAARAIQDQQPDVVALRSSTARSRAVRLALAPYRHLGKADGVEIWTSTNLPPVLLPGNGPRAKLRAMGL